LRKNQYDLPLIKFTYSPIAVFNPRPDEVLKYALNVLHLLTVVKIEFRNGIKSKSGNGTKKRGLNSAFSLLTKISVPVDLVDKRMRTTAISHLL